MLNRKTEETARIHVRDDHGHPHTITEVTHFFQTTSLDGTGPWTKDRSEYRVDTGGLAAKMSDSQFHLIGSGRIATRV